MADLIAAADLPAGDQAIPNLLRTLTDEMKLLRESNQNVVTALERITKVENDIASMKADQEKIHEIIRNQQVFMETIDSRERQCNLIITGLPETAGSLADNDEGRVMKVIGIVNDAIKQEDIVEAKRLGAAGEGKKRPLLVRLSDKKKRDSIVENSKALKAFQGDDKEVIQQVYVKKDIHPALRKEYDRLRKVLRLERTKAENEGTNISYDSRRRVVTRDGLVIDRFNPNF